METNKNSSINERIMKHTEKKDEDLEDQKQKMMQLPKEKRPVNNYISSTKNTKRQKKKNRNDNSNTDKKKMQLNKSHFSRINYLYQISRLDILSNKNNVNCANTLCVPSHISRMYIKNMDSISKKTTSKLHPRLKRDICKNCQTILIEGISKSVRLEECNSGGIGNFVIMCLNCENIVKRFPLKIGETNNFVPFAERDGVCLQVD